MSTFLFHCLRPWSDVHHLLLCTGVIASLSQLPPAGSPHFMPRSTLQPQKQSENSLTIVLFISLLFQCRRFTGFNESLEWPIQTPHHGLKVSQALAPTYPSSSGLTASPHRVNAQKGHCSIGLEFAPGFPTLRLFSCSPLPWHALYLPTFTR